MPLVFTASRGGASREVKNLGWLLRHHSEVQSLVVAELDRGEAFLIAYLQGPRGWMRYEAHFGSFTVAYTWVNRPRFESTPLTVCPQGAPAYKTAAGCGFVSPARMAEIRARAGDIARDLRAHRTSL